MPWPALCFVRPGRAGGFDQMLLNVPERQLITPMVRKITLRFWVSRIFKTNRKEEETLNKNSNLFLRTKPRKLLVGRGHIFKSYWGWMLISLYR